MRFIVHKVMSLEPLNFGVIFIGFVRGEAGSCFWSVCIRILHGFAGEENGMGCENFLTGNVEALENRESVTTRVLVDEIGGSFAAESFGRQTLEDIGSSVLSQVYEAYLTSVSEKRALRGEAYESSQGSEHIFQPADIPIVALQ
jgi:hypothetical protein